MTGVFFWSLIINILRDFKVTKHVAVNVTLQSAHLFS